MEDAVSGGFEILVMDLAKELVTSSIGCPFGPLLIGHMRGVVQP
jgi:hypothetical protein